MSTGNITLYRAARLLYLAGVPTVFCGLLISSPRTAASLPFIAAPTFWLLWKRSRLADDKRPHLETLIWTYVLSGTFGVALVATAQSIGGYALALLLLGSRTDEYLEEFGRTTLDDVSTELRQKRAEMSWTWQYLVLLLSLAFVLASLLEEYMKYYTVTYVKHRSGRLHALDYIAYAIASAIGFSTIENVGFVYASASVDSLKMTALTLAERIVIAMPGHALMGMLTATRMIQRDLKGVHMQTWRLLYPSVLYHGLFDFIMFGVSAIDGNVGWIHPREPSRVLLLLILAVSMLSTLAWHVRSSIGMIDLR